MIKLKKILPAGLLAMLALTVNLVSAEPADAEVQERIKNSLAVLLPGIEPDSIESTPMKDLYQVIFGPRLVYISADGKFLLQGSIIDLETREDLTEPRLMTAKIEALDKIGEDNMIVYSPAKGTASKYHVSIFTDIDCGYCRKLHSEMADYNKAGIEIRYLFYPRAGMGSESYRKAEQVWCSDDRHAAMDLAKAGKKLDSNVGCKNPVEEHMTLGSLIGISGTPAMVLSDGKLIPGYVPADRLVKLLDARKAAALD